MLSFSSQESAVLRAHIPEPQHQAAAHQAAARPLSCAPDPPHEDGNKVGGAAAGGKLTSAKSCRHSVVPRPGSGPQYNPHSTPPTAGGPRGSGQEGSQGTGCQREAPVWAEQQAKSGTRKCS